jgi:uridine kinase
MFRVRLKEAGRPADANRTVERLDARVLYGSITIHPKGTFMEGDRIVIEPHHQRAARQIDAYLAEHSLPGEKRFVITVAGESGSGKSETAAALAEALAGRGIDSVIFQQDDYFVHPPKSNDRVRRDDIDWVGPGEVRLKLLDEHLDAFRRGENAVTKPLVRYAEDRVDEEILDLEGFSVAIAEGTYTTLLDSADLHLFIDRTWEQTRAHREKRSRDAAELDPFIDRVLKIEHEIISKNKRRADLIIEPDYRVHVAGEPK